MAKLSILVSVLVLVVAIGYVEYRLPAAVETAPAKEVDLEPIRSELAGLREFKKEAEDRILALEAGRMEAVPSSAEPVGPVGAATVGSGAPKPPSPEEATRRAELVSEFLEDLATGQVTREQIDGLWDSLPGSGLEKRAVAAFKAHVKANPEDADAHYGLGVALTSEFLGGKASQMEIMQLSAQADAQFTKALEIDDNHFSARFSKAISYTFYPPIAGKGPEAIRHFEILVERHGGDPSIPEMEEAYFNLGNEYKKIGNFDKARAAYETGLRVFPDSSRMKGQVEAMSK